MNKPTPGPWGYRYRFNPGDREHDQIDAYAITANNGEATIAETLFSCKDDEANTALIVAAANACFAINPSNPLAVAEGMPELVGALRGLVLEFDNNNALAVGLGENMDEDTNEMRAARAALAKLGGK